MQSAKRTQCTTSRSRTKFAQREITSTITKRSTVLCFYELKKFHDVLQRSMARNQPVDALFPLLSNALFRFLPKRHSEKVFEDAGRFFVILTETAKYNDRLSFYFECPTCSTRLRGGTTSKGPRLAGDPQSDAIRGSAPWRPQIQADCAQRPRRSPNPPLNRRCNKDHVCQERNLLPRPKSLQFHASTAEQVS